MTLIVPKIYTYIYIYIIIVAVVFQELGNIFRVTVLVLVLVPMAWAESNLDPDYK